MGACRAGGVFHVRLAAKGPPGSGLIKGLFLPLASLLSLATISVGVVDVSQEQAVVRRPISQPPVISNYSGTRKRQRRQQGQHLLGQPTSHSMLHSTGPTRRLMRAEVGSLADNEVRHEGVKDDSYYGRPPWNAKSMIYGKQSSNSGSAVDAAAEEATRNAIAEGLAPVDVALAANYAARSSGGSHKQCVEASLSASIQAALAAGGTALHVGKTAGEAISAAGGDAKDKMTAAVAAATQAALNREGDPLLVAKIAAATAQATGASVADMVIAATNAATRAAMATETSPDKVGKVASDAAKLAGASPAEVIKAAGFGAMTAYKTFGGSAVDIEEAQESAEQAALKHQEIENEQRAEEQRIENERKDEQKHNLQAEVQRRNLLRATEQVEQQRKAAEHWEKQQDVPQEKRMKQRQHNDIRKIEGADVVTVGSHQQLIHPLANDPPLYVQRQIEEPQRYTQAELQTNRHVQAGSHDGKQFEPDLQGAPQADGEAVRQLVVQPAPQLVAQPALEERVVLRDQHDFQQHANKSHKSNADAESQTKVDVTQLMQPEREIGTIQPDIRVQRSVEPYMPARHEADAREETHRMGAGVKQSIQPELEIDVTQPDMKARGSVELYMPAQPEADAQQKTHQEEAGVQLAADTSGAQQRAQAMDAAQRELAVQTLVNSKIAAQREVALHTMARHHAEATQRKLDAQRKQAPESIYYGDAQDEAREDAVDELRYMRLLAAQRDAEAQAKSWDSMQDGPNRQGESKTHGTQHCFAWAYQGYCSSPMHATYMANTCAFECVAKDFESTAIESFDGGVADPTHQCINWADIGLCSNPHYSMHMMKICADVCATKKAAVQEHQQLTKAPLTSQQRQFKLQNDTHPHTAQVVPEQHATQWQLGPQRQFSGTSEVHTDIDEQLHLAAHQGTQHREPQQVTIPPQRSHADAESEGAPPQDIAVQQQPYRKQFPLAQQLTIPKKQTLEHRTGPGDDLMPRSMPAPVGQLERRPFETMQRRIYAGTPQIPDAFPNPSIGQAGRRPFELEQQRVYSESQQQADAFPNRGVSPHPGRRHFEVEQQRVYSVLPQQPDAPPNQVAPQQPHMAHQQPTAQPAWPQQPPPPQPPAQQPPPHPEEVPLQPLPFHDPLPPPSVSNSPLPWPQASRTAPPAAQVSASSLPEPSRLPSVIRADLTVPPVPLPVTPTEDSQWTPPPESGNKPAVEYPIQGGANEPSNASSSEGIGHRRRTSSSNSIGSMEPRRSPYMKGPRPPSEALTIAPSVVIAGRCSDTEGLGIISDEQQCQAASSVFGSTYSGTGNWPWMPRGCTRSAHNVIKFNRNADARVACGQDYACICDKVISWYSTVSSGVCEDWPGRFTVSNARDCRTAADRMGLSWRGSGNFTILAKGCNSNKYDGVHYNDNKESPRQCGYGEQDCICSDTRVLLQPGEKANPFWFTLLADDLSTAEEFEMSFNLKPHAPAPHDGWANILRITVSDTEHGNYGDMMPAFYFIPGTTRLRVAMGRQGEHDAGCDVGGSGLILGQTARVIARLIGDTFAVFINGVQGCVATGYDSKYTASPRARVYISDAFSSPAQVTVSGLIYRSQVGSQLKRIVAFPVAGLIAMEVDSPTDFVANVETQTAAENAIAVMANVLARDVKAELDVEDSRSLLADASKRIELGNFAFVGPTPAPDDIALAKSSWRAGWVNVKYTIDSIDEVSGNAVMGSINDRSLTNVTAVMNGQLLAQGLGAGYTVKVTSSWAQKAAAATSIEAVEGRLLQPDSSTSTEAPSTPTATTTVTPVPATPAPTPYPTASPTAVPTSPTLAPTTPQPTPSPSPGPTSVPTTKPSDTPILNQSAPTIIADKPA